MSNAEQSLRQIMGALQEAEWQREQLLATIKFIKAEMVECRGQPGADEIHPKAWESVEARLLALQGK